MNRSHIPYLLDTRTLEFEVAKTAVPKVDDAGRQKIDTATGNPVWAVEVNVWAGEDQGCESWTVSVASSTRPALEWRQPVEPVELEMLPWSSERNGKFRSGVAFRAKEILPVAVQRVAAAA